MFHTSIKMHRLWPTRLYKGLLVFCLLASNAAIGSESVAAVKQELPSLHAHDVSKNTQESSLQLISSPNLGTNQPNNDELKEQLVINADVDVDNVAKDSLVNEVLVDQRNRYTQTLIAISKGHKTNIRRGLLELKNYPLYSYLVAHELRQRLKTLPFKEVDAFLHEYGDSVAGNQLRKHWLAMLKKKKRWSHFIHYFDQDIYSTSLHCGYLEALYHTGFIATAHAKTSELWLSDKSLPNSCNSIFKRWELAGGKTDELVWDRIKLALLKNNTALARFLSERSSNELKPYTRRLINVHRKPQRLVTTDDFKDGSTYTTDIINHGLNRLLSRDFRLADKLWFDYRGYIDFSSEQFSAIRNKLARQIIASGSEDALKWLIVQDPNAEDSFLLEWRIRLALKQKKWSQAEQWITLLPVELQQQPRWRYWHARAYQQMNKKVEVANELLQTLSTERHYYGFLAADALNSSYGFNHTTQPITDISHRVDNVPAIKRAYEFFHLGKLTQARREWRASLDSFSQSQMMSATALANNWGWHQQAITTTIRAQQWNDLSIRFPLAHRSHMTGAAKSTTIRLEWLYAVARQESAFAEDAYSSAGARGLLQLTPGTAKDIANKIGVSYVPSDLYIPDKNITLGSAYLKQLLEAFQGNHILATAAYNAGPHRVRKWLKQQQFALPHDIWIETLPFYETRSYIQNVLAFSVIYGYRLGIDVPLIGAQESLISEP